MVMQNCRAEPSMMAQSGARQVALADPREFATAPYRLRVLEFVSPSSHLNSSEIASRLQLYSQESQLRGSSPQLRRRRAAISETPPDPLSRYAGGWHVGCYLVGASRSSPDERLKGVLMKRLVLFLMVIVIAGSVAVAQIERHRIVAGGIHAPGRR